MGVNMRERRWESLAPMRYDEVLALCERLTRQGLSIRGIHQEGACYFEEFTIDRLDEIARLDPWPVDEVTLVQVIDRWEGDFFLLVGEHHQRYLASHGMDAYLSLSHPWRFPIATLHHDEAMFWIGFRQTHGFIRFRVVPRTIITPAEGGTEAQRDAWWRERAEAFEAAIEVLGLPLFVDWSDGVPTVSSTDPGYRVSGSWPDAFGPCQIEAVSPDRWELLVPAARLVETLGIRPATLRIFLSGFSPSQLSGFHALQPSARMVYRGYLHASLGEIPAIVEAIAPHGRALVTLGEFRTGDLLGRGEDAYAVVGVIGSQTGYLIELRLNRAPLAEAEMASWLESVLGVPMVYAPLALY